MQSLLKTMFAIIATLSILSCTKEEEEITPNTGNGTLTLHFDNQAPDGNAITVNSGSFKFRDTTFEVTSLKYFVSNIMLIGDEDTFMIPDSYYLIDQSKMESYMRSVEVPEGDYNSIMFYFGIDSLANIDVSNTSGDLGPSDMPWNWNNKEGYKFLKFEGTRKSSSDTASTGLMLHVGHNSKMFASYDEAYKPIHLSLGGGHSMSHSASERTMHSSQKIEILSGKTTKAHIKVDFTKIYEGTSIAATDKKMVPGNMVKAFMLHHVEHD